MGHLTATLDISQSKLLTVKIFKQDIASYVKINIKASIVQVRMLLDCTGNVPGTAQR